MAIGELSPKTKVREALTTPAWRKRAVANLPPGRMAVDAFQRGGVPEAIGGFVRGTGQAANQLTDAARRNVVSMPAAAISHYGGRVLGGLTGDLPTAPRHDELAAGNATHALPQTSTTPSPTAPPSTPVTSAPSPAKPQVLGTFGGTQVFTLPGSNAFADKDNIATLTGGEAAPLPQAGEPGFGNPVVMNNFHTVPNESIGAPATQNSPQSLPMARSGAQNVNPTLTSALKGFDFQKALRDANRRADKIVRESLNATGGRGVTRAARQAAAAVRSQPFETLQSLAGSQADLQSSQLQAQQDQFAALLQAGQGDREQTLKEQQFLADQQRNRASDRREFITGLGQLMKPVTVTGGIDPNTQMPTQQTVQFNPQTGRYEVFRLPPTLQQFLQEARQDPRNEQYSDQELTQYYRQNYGR